MSKKLLQATIKLFILSFIAKLLSFSIKLQLAKSMSNQTIELYTLASSTMLFLITFVQAGIPTTINTLIAKQKHHFSILQNSIFLSFITNTIAIIIYLLIIPIITNQSLLYNQTPVLLSIIPLLPLVTISGICKGYCLGKQKILLANASNITEEIVRIVFLVIVYPYVQHSPSLYASFAILSIAIGEIGAIFHILFFLKSSKHIPKLFYKNYLSLPQMKEIATYAIYMSSSRFIGSFTHFLEPLLFTLHTNLFLHKELITTFTFIHAYVLPIITLPSFFTFALSTWLLSSLSHHLANHHFQQAKKILNYVIFISLIIGFTSGILCYLFPTQITTLFYNNSQSAELLKRLSLPFILFSIQSPLSTALHAYNKSNYTLYASILGNVIKIIMIIILPKYIGTTALEFAITSSMLVTTCFHLYHLRHLLANNPQSICFP